jgi:hypothetical protein
MVSPRMDARLRAIVLQASRPDGTPVVLLTRKTQPLWVIIPFANDNHEWLGESRTRRTYHYVRDKDPHHWAVPKSWLNALTRRLVDRFGACYLVQALRQRETCAPACWDAHGLECECSCMGEHHGEGHPDGRWYVVSETCAVGWGEKRLHYKLIRLRKP